MSLPVMNNDMLDEITTKSAIQKTRKKSFDNGQIPKKLIVNSVNEKVANLDLLEVPEISNLDFRNQEPPNSQSQNMLDSQVD